MTQMPQGSQPSIVDAQVRMIKALADPVRVAIVTELSRSEATFEELAERLGMPPQKLAKHLAGLGKAGIISGCAQDQGQILRLRLPFLKRFLRDLEATAEAEAQQEFLEILGYT